MLRAGLAIVGLAAMAFAALHLLELPPGFPDGYISPYRRATSAWLTGLTFAVLLAGIFTLAAAVMGKPRRAIAGGVGAVILASAFWLLDTCPRLDWCVSAVQQTTGIMTDDGQGG